MSATSGRDCFPWSWCARVLLVACGLAGATGQPALGNPIRHPRHQQTVSSQTLDPVQAYFLHALQTHSIHVHVPAQLRPLRATDGLLPQTPFVHYLEWRRSLDPSRFDRFHPHLGPMLVVDQKIRQSLALTPPPPQTTPTIYPPGFFNPQPQIVTPPPSISTPPPVVNGAEPSTALLGVILAGAAAWARSRRRAIG